jgi:hypothetical protein
MAPSIQDYLNADKLSSDELVDNTAKVSDTVEASKSIVPSSADARDRIASGITEPTLLAGTDQTYTQLSPSTAEFANLSDQNQYATTDTATPVASATASLASTPEAIIAAGFDATEAGAFTATAAAKYANLQDTLINQTPEMVAAQMSSLQGEAAQGIADQINIEDALASLETQPSQMQAVIATLPENALVTSQMNQLLSGLEGGKTPAWAKPAVDQVDDILAARGLGKSSVGRDALFNAIISAAMPLAQSNAQALQTRANLNLGYANEAEKFNAGLRQQMNISVNDKVALFIGQNSQLRQQMTLANMTASDRMEMANLEFEFATNKENMSAENSARLENLRSEMLVKQSNQEVMKQVGLAEMAGEQQAFVLDSQMNANRILQNANAENVAKQFNAASENQVNTFMTELKTQISQYNANLQTTVSQYNAGSENSLAQFDSQQTFQRESFNANMYNVINQANIQYRRQINTVNTAGENAVNQANAMNLFNISQDSLNKVWQEMRDNANFAFTNTQNQSELAFRTMISTIEAEKWEALQKTATGKSLGKFVETLIDSFTS